MWWYKPIRQVKQTVSIDVSQWQEPEEGDIFTSLGIEFGRMDGEATIGVVTEGSAAERSELLANDRIVRLNGKAINLWSEFTQVIVENPNQPINALIERNGLQFPLTITPGAVKRGEQEVGYLGVRPLFLLATMLLITAFLRLSAKVLSKLG